MIKRGGILGSTLVLLAGVLLGACATASPTSSTSPLEAPAVAVPALDAGAAASALAGQGIVTKLVPTTAETDPNDLLGRPGQYSARVTFTIPATRSAGSDKHSCDRGGCIEQWPDEAAAQKRADYIKQLGERLPLAVEYDTVRPDGLLLRINRSASPAAAKKVQDAFAAL